MSITNNSKRKGRIPSNTNNRAKPTRVRPKERSLALDGVYSNARFMHAAASSVGCVVHIQVKNGNVYEGVFSTFSQDLDIVLEMVNLVGKNTKFGELGNCSNSILTSFDVEDCIAEKMVFKLGDIVATCASNIDLEFATKDGFTDGAISKFAGSIPERELEPWDGASDELQSVNSLDVEEETKGWDANEMFRTNAEKYNVKSTYDSSLQGYTIPLEPKNTDEYKKQEAKASKIAQEIENNPSYKQRVSVENGDEEERFSAVLRPVDNMSSPASRYAAQKKGIPPIKIVRNTMPSFSHQNKPQNQPIGNMNSCITPTHSFNKTSNSVPTPPNSLPIMTSQPNVISNKPHMPLPIPSPQQHQAPPPMVPPAHFMPNLQTRPPINHSGTPPHPCSEPSGIESMEKPDSQQVHSLQLQDNKINPEYRFQDENVAPQSQDPSSMKPGEKRRDEKKGGGRDEQIAEFKKFSSDFKLEDHRQNRDDVRDSPSEECTSPPQKEKNENEELVDEGTPDSDGSKINKKHVWNPNAKAFTPRAAPSATPPATAPPPRMHTQSPIVAVQQHQHPHHQQHQLLQGLGQPIFTPMGPQYVMSTPVSMALTPSFAPGTMTPAHRFSRKPVQMGVQGQQDFSHVAAATGQPILTPGIPSPAQLVQYNPTQGMMTGHSPHQTAMAYSQMMYRYPMVGPRVVSPQPVGSYGELFMSPHPGAGQLQGPHSVSVGAVQSMVSQGNQGPHSNPQPTQNQGQCTPMHAAPSPVHQQGQQTPHGTPSQTPTPGHVVPCSTPQTVVYHGQMTQSMQGGLHTPPIPSTQAMQLHSHISQSHPHSHHANFATTQHVVLMHQQAVPTHGPHPGTMTSSGPHSLQGHAIHGQTQNHLGNPPHVISHAPMTVIPTSTAMVHAQMAGNPFAPHQHQNRDRGRPHTGNR